jgi:hypothetical protein
MLRVVKGVGILGCRGAAPSFKRLQALKYGSDHKWKAVSFCQPNQISIFLSRFSRHFEFANTKWYVRTTSSKPQFLMVNRKLKHSHGPPRRLVKPQKYPGISILLCILSKALENTPAHIML